MTVNDQRGDTMKSQWVVQTENKLTRWGWERYFRSEADARIAYESLRQNKTLIVKIYKEVWS